MKELISRLTAHPFLLVEILLATFFIALLNLASPLFVINVLNRYVSYGFDGTLITLTAGMLIAIALQYGFRVSRTKMLGSVSAGPDTTLAKNLMTVLSRARSGAIERWPNARIQETANGLQTVQTAYDASSLSAILDAPFSLLYIVAAYFLSPLLALIAFAGILFALAAGALSIMNTRRTTEELQRTTMAHRGLITSAVSSIDTVRAFEGKTFLDRIWNNQIQKITSLRLNLANKKEQSQSFTQTINLLMSVGLYAVGAVLVVNGKMTVGALIGANILASRSFQSVVRFVQTGFLLNKAKEARLNIDKIMLLPLESEKGAAIQQYKGGIKLNDLGFAFQGSAAPLYESVNLDLAPGSILAITGKNGTGKTTLARLLLALLIPSRGDILADGISLRQVAQVWWRRQVQYFPQEPTFIDATIRENISMIRPDISTEEINRVIREADLKTFLDRTQDGLETRLVGDGRYFSLGIRRRIALARALTTNGMLAVFDEPTEGLDADGCKAVYSVLNKLSGSGRTIIVFSQDPNIVKVAHILLDLNEKPVPKVIFRGQEPTPVRQRAE